MWFVPKRVRMVQFKGCSFLCVHQFCIEKCRWEFGSCPLSGIKKRPLLRGCLSVITMVISIRNTECVHCREVVHFSEGPLSEVRLYFHALPCKV